MAAQETPILASKGTVSLTSAPPVAKKKDKSTAFLYIAKRHQTLSTLYINTRGNFVFYSIYIYYIYIYIYILLLLLLLLEIRNRVVPTGSTPKGGPTEITLYHPGHSSPPGLVSVSVPSPPVLMSCILHPVRTLPCPIHIPYRVSGLFLPRLSVLHIYSNPTEKNPSTNIKPHIQTVLIHYFNKQTIKRAVYHYLVSPPVSSVPTCSSAPYLHQ